MAFYDQHTRRACGLEDPTQPRSKSCDSSHMPMFARWLSLVVLVVAGCITHKDTVCGGDLICSNPDKPFCDIDGAVSGQPQTCIGVTCTPGNSVACRGDQAVVCNATGDDFELDDCANGCTDRACNACIPGVERCASNGDLVKCGENGVETVESTCMAGCTASPAPHCSYLQPRYLPETICDTLATADAYTISTDTTLDTNDPTACNGGILTQASDSPICVLRYRSITVAANATLLATPASTFGLSNTPALALVADDLIDIQGTLDASAQGELSGAGGGTYKSGSPGSANHAPSVTSSGGGAGGATAGGMGCQGPLVGAGPAVTDAGLVDVLRGGGVAGGGGGGAITLVACRGSVHVSGTVAINGGGGPGGSSSSVYQGGGGGGGAGGVAAFQGLNVQVSGHLFANGGGGGGGVYCGTNLMCNGAGEGPGGPGGDGGKSLVSAAGGLGDAVGGTGGTAGALPGKGICDNVGAHPHSMAGGGGSVGFLVTFAPANATVGLTPSVASPSPEPSRTATVR